MSSELNLLGALTLWEMRITELQNEANHLLFLYFTSIGVIQRDANSDDIEDKIHELRREIEECRERMLKYMEENVEKVKLRDDYEDIVAEGKKFVRDGFCFLDRMLDTNEEWQP